MSAISTRKELLNEINSFAETDLLCYRAPTTHIIPGQTQDDMLRAKQDATFDPILDWIFETYGARFAVTDSVMPVAQAPEALAAIAAAFATTTDAELLTLAELTALLGSALLTLAVWKRAIPLANALAAARLDEQAAADRYGLDPVIAAKWESTEVKIRECFHRIAA